MNLVVVGVSYRTAPLSILERLATPPAAIPQTLTALLSQPQVGEAVVVSTCNRVEVYAGVNSFHGGLTEIVAVLADRAGCSPADLAPYAYVYYEGEAARHGYHVATGLDSMVLGEAHILGQMRDAYALATEHDAVGRLLHELLQRALRVGKRAHTETGIDRAGQSLVSAALSLAAGPAGLADLAGRPALVIGAGAMGSLALATLNRAGAAPLYLSHPRPEKATRVAQAHHAAVVSTVDLSGIEVVVSATTATEYVVAPHHITQPVTIVDLAVPRDVDPAVADLPGVRLIDLQTLAATLANRGLTQTSPRLTDGPAGCQNLAADHQAVEDIVSDEVDAFLGWLRGAEVAPTVAALRTKADDLVATELRRLAQRRPELTMDQRADISRTMHRVVQQLLHQPTVRVRELAAGPGGERYAVLLRELFDLDPGPGRLAADIPGVES